MWAWLVISNPGTIERMTQRERPPADATAARDSRDS